MAQQQPNQVLKFNNHRRFLRDKVITVKVYDDRFAKNKDTIYFDKVSEIRLNVAHLKKLLGTVTRYTFTLNSPDKEFTVQFDLQRNDPDSIASLSQILKKTRMKIAPYLGESLTTQIRNYPKTIGYIKFHPDYMEYDPATRLSSDRVGYQNVTGWSVSRDFMQISYVNQDGQKAVLKSPLFESNTFVIPEVIKFLRSR